MSNIVNHPKVQRTRSCWVWTGPTTKGYGTLGAKRVHRLSYAQNIGPLKPGLQICHKCDVKNCLRPSHLYQGTASDNLRDAYQRKRRRLQSESITHCKHGHEFTKENTGYKQPGDRGKRYCRECKRIVSAKRQGGSVKRTRYHKLHPLNSHQVKS